MTFNVKEKLNTYLSSTYHIFLTDVFMELIDKRKLIKKFEIRCYNVLSYIPNDSSSGTEKDLKYGKTAIFEFQQFSNWYQFIL